MIQPGLLPVLANVAFSVASTTAAGRLSSVLPLMLWMKSQTARIGERQICHFFVQKTFLSPEFLGFICSRLHFKKVVFAFHVGHFLWSLFSFLSLKSESVYVQFWQEGENLIQGEGTLAVPWCSSVVFLLCMLAAAAFSTTTPLHGKWCICSTLLEMLNYLSLLPSSVTILVNGISINCILGPVQFFINADALIIYCPEFPPLFQCL